MNREIEVQALLKLIGQAAVLVSGSLMILAASVLFASLVIADHPGPTTSIIALLNAAMFYLWGLGSIRYVHTTWKAAEARPPSVKSGSPPDA